MNGVRGLSAFPITPANETGTVDTSALRNLLAPLCAAGVDSIGLLGSTGTYMYLTRAERRRAIETAVELADGKTPILVGVGALRTDEAVALAQDAKAIGAAGGLLAPASYTPLMADEVYEHFAVVAHESGLPLVIYDNPGTTHFKFTPELVGRVARIPGVVALKAPAPDAASIGAHAAELLAVLPSGFPLGYSADWNTPDGLLAGAETWYSVLGGTFPKVCLSIVRAAQRQDATEVRRLNASLEPLWEVFRTYSSLRVVFAIAAMRGLTRANPPRPILPLPEAARAKVTEVLAALDLS